ncbi:hypothetical protein EYF80_005616 [Liparis tanakae]|uniref:Uncharacterized protein n=1 Tax=Liparis tanakae TaxID=230148 RepID=A0A4Z2J249_9TELE|nr:hypothetical protein EYF80_005616 [Liparis tanakae]
MAIPDPSLHIGTIVHFSPILFILPVGDGRFDQETRKTTGLCSCRCCEEMVHNHPKRSPRHAMRVTYFIKI